MTRSHRLCAVLTAAALLSLVLAPAALAFDSPNSPSSGELVETPKAYDGKSVTFEGEAIGEAMVRGEGAWLHLNDDAYMYKNVEEGAKLDGYNSGMPVYVSAQLAGKVTTFGDYKHEGDIVRVSGTFNAACRQHGGDMDIHATTLEVTTPGHPAQDPVHPWKIWLAFALTIAAGLAWFADRTLNARELTGWLRRK